MRIIIVTQTFPPKYGGMQSVMKSIAEELSKYSNIVVIPNSFVNKKILSEGKRGIQLFQFCMPKIIMPLIKKVFLYFFANDKDIFICDSWKSINAIPKKFSEKIYVFAHGQEFLKNKNHTRIKKSLENINTVISNSQFTKNLSSKFLKKNIKNIVIPPTYMLPNKLAKPLYSKKNNAVFITISRLEERKGILQSMIALRNIHIKYPKLAFTWHILGSGPQLTILKNFVNEFNLHNSIKFYGDADENLKKSLLKISSLFIMPSYKFENSIEGFGIVYAEALRYGIPSVAGLEGGVTDVIKNNINGWNINPNNIDKLEKLFLKILNNPEILKKLGRNGQKIYLDKFSKKITIKKFMNIIY